MPKYEKVSCTFSIYTFTHSHSTDSSRLLQYAETERFSVRNDHGDGFVRELKHFHECVRGREAPLCVAWDGLAVLAIIDAAHRSAESGVPEAVELAPHL